MGDIIDFATTAVDHCHPLRRSRSSSSIIRITDHQYEPMIILAFRAISEHIGRCKAFLQKRTPENRFQLLSSLLCGAIHAKGTAASDRFKMYGILLCGVMSDYIRGDKKDQPVDVLRDLPEDLFWTIFFKLPLDAAVRTSALSWQWRYLWKNSPKLSFDGDALCGHHKNSHRKRVYTLMFLRIVNTVLAQYRGKLVEELVVRIELNWMLVEHLDNWVRFALSSRTKTLVFDLAPEEHQLVGRHDRYRFPFELLDKDSMCHLEIIYLSFVNFQPPMHFSGFPKLRKLDLNLVNVNGKDIAHVLSNCCSLEWLSIVRCHLNGELKVNCPLPRLLYLKIASCNLTNVEFHAVVNLATFEYRGLAVPIDLSKSLELKCANIWYFGHNLEHTITVLDKVLTNVRHLILNAGCKPPKIPRLMHYPCEFFRMTHLQLRLVYAKEFDSWSLISFLRSAPSIEKLELHFCNTSYVRVEQEPEPIRGLPELLFNDMKSLHITGFEACKGEVEFLLHMVENAPALEVLSIDHSYQYPLEGFKRDTKLVVDLVHSITRRHLEGKISPDQCTLILL